MTFARGLLTALAVGAVACSADPEPGGTAPSGAAPAAEMSSAPEPPPGAEPIAVCRGLVRGAVPERANLVVVVNDTMRRDRPGIYGGEAKTPHFDAFAEANHLFRRALSQAPWTKPAVSTLFTGLFPAQHGVLDTPEWRPPGHQGWSQADVLDGGIETLAEVLRRSGFRTAAFVSNPWMQRRFGFDQGFEVYEDSFADWDAPGGRVVDAALAWLDGLAPDERFFLYVHTIDSHRPYGALSAGEVLAARERIEADARPVPRSDLAFLGQARLLDGRPWAETGVVTSPTLIEMAYDRGVENFDRALGTLLDALAERPSWDRTAVIVTSDHGESLYERGYGNHGLGLYQEDLAIPLAARLPGVTGPGEIDCPVGLVDVLPSVCSYLDLRCAEPVAGVSWLESGHPDQTAPRYLVSEAVENLPRSRAIQNARYKLLYRPDGRYDENGALRRRPPDEFPYSLFDLVADPGEKRDLLVPGVATPEAVAIARFLGDEMQQVVSRIAPVAPPTAPLDPAQRERLEALGYALPGAPAK